MFAAPGRTFTRSAVSTCWFRVLLTSTRGAAPRTVRVSATAPTPSSTSTSATKAPWSVTPSRTTVPKPCNVKVTVYSPEGRLVTRKFPDASLNASRSARSAGLVTLTDTPGNTPPVSSTILPPMPASSWAQPVDGASTRPATISTIIAPMFLGISLHFLQRPLTSGLSCPRQTDTDR